MASALLPERYHLETMRNSTRPGTDLPVFMVSSTSCTIRRPSSPVATNWIPAVIFRERVANLGFSIHSFSIG